VNVTGRRVEGGPAIVWIAATTGSAATPSESIRIQAEAIGEEAYDRLP